MQRYCDDHASKLPEVTAAEEARVIELDAKVASACRQRGSQPHLLATRTSHACYVLRRERSATAISLLRTA